MWALNSGRLRRWLIFAVALPLGLLAIRKIRESVQERNGETTVTKVLGKVEQLGRRQARSKGPYSD